MFTKNKPKHKSNPRMFKNWHSFKFIKLGQKVESTEAFSLLLSFMVNLIALYIFCISLVYMFHLQSVMQLSSNLNHHKQTKKTMKENILVKGGIFHSTSKIV